MGGRDAKLGEIIIPPASSFVNQRPTRLRFANAFVFGNLGGACGTKRVFWRWTLPGAVGRRTAMHNTKMRDQIKLTSAVLKAYVMR